MPPRAPSVLQRRDLVIARPMQNRTPSRPPARKAPPDFTPVPRKCKRHDGWTPARQKAFIDALSDAGSVKAAAAAVNMSPEGAYYLRRQPGAEEFAAAWDAALDHRIEILRDAALDRAIHGVEVPVYSYGKLVGARRVYNDRLGQFMLANYDGRLGTTASGPRLHHRRMIDEAVAKARAEWEAERQKRDEDHAQGATERVRAMLEEIDERLRASEEARGEYE